MPKAIRFHKTGGPEVLVWEDVEVGDPGPGQARVRQNRAVGLNYIDVYHRSGLYPLPLPSGIGLEAARRGRERSAAGVTDVKSGDRVAYAVARRSAPMRKCASSRRPPGEAARTASPSTGPRR